MAQNPQKLTKSVNFSAKKRQLNGFDYPCGISGLISINGTRRRS
jgi:hypothetical protein